MIDAVRTTLRRYSWQGVMRPDIIADAIKRDAKVIGPISCRCTRISRRCTSDF
jgi:hypothetical protein